MKNKQQGAALLVAMLLSALVAVIGVVLVKQQQQQLLALQQMQDADKAWRVVEWIENAAMLSLQNLFLGYEPVFAQEETDNMVVALNGEWQQPLGPWSVGDVVVQGQLFDEQALLDINSLAVRTGRGESLEEQISEIEAERIARARARYMESDEQDDMADYFTADSDGVDETASYHEVIAVALLRLLSDDDDWQFIAQDPQYMLTKLLEWQDWYGGGDWFDELQDMHPVAYMPMVSRSELLLVDGFAASYPQLLAYVTVIPAGVADYGSEPIAINVNTTSDRVLAAVLDIPQSGAQAIIGQRPFWLMDDFWQAVEEHVVRLDEDLYSSIREEKGLFVTNTSDYFLLETVVEHTEITQIFYTLFKHAGDGSIEKMWRMAGSL